MYEPLGKTAERATEQSTAPERRETALEAQIESLRQVSELLHDVRATGIMYETQSLAVRALRELLDDPDRNDWDELVAANRALIKAIVTGKPMTRRNVRIVAEYLREAGWQEHAIGAATAQTGIHAGAN